MDHGLELIVLVLAAVVAALATGRARAATLTAPSLVVELVALMLLGPLPTMLVAAARITTTFFAGTPSPYQVREALVRGASGVLAIQGAGAAYALLGGTAGHFAWPWQALPIAAAIAIYAIVECAAVDFVLPFVTKRSINRSWPKTLVEACSTNVLAASIGAGLVELVEHRLWNVLPVAAVPLYFAYRAYSKQEQRVEDDHRRQEVIESLDQGMSVLDSSGRVTLWSDALEHILDCPRGRAVGRPIDEAIPSLRKTALPRAIEDAAKSGNPQTIAPVEVGTGDDVRALEVKVLPVIGGVTLLWQDITERARAEQVLKRSEERLALAAEGANDGLWEWDRRNQEFYFSGRWRAMLGLPAEAGVGRLEEWFDRVHPEDLPPLKEALEPHLSGKTDRFQHEHRIRHENGSYRRFLCQSVAVRGAGRRAIRVAGSLTDTTDQAKAREQLHNAGFRDPLTGLSNRAVFAERLGHRLNEFRQQRSGPRFAALYLDLDRFKVVNDSLGHIVGDELLTAVSRRLESCLRPGDVLARLGGDEFAILLNGLGDDQQANAIALRIQRELSAPFSIGGRKVFTSASIGIAFGRQTYTDPEEIMRDADTAMYHAKSRGKARHELFDADMHARALDRLGLENDLRHAVNGNDFEVYYQPIVSLASGMCVGFESLVRWTRNGESISPATFIPIAEELGIVEPLGTWVLQQACNTFADWQRRYPDRGLDCITVNVSSRQLMQQDFLYTVEQAVAKARLRPADLRLEITETAIMDSPTIAAGVLKDLRDFGVKIYLDDFGTGYSSLSHLHKLPVDALKIDRSFVRSLILPDRPAIVESILALARTLDTSVVAEGIEDVAQALELERLGCTHAQGFLFSRPRNVGSVEELLKDNQPLGPKCAWPNQLLERYATVR